MRQISGGFGGFLIVFLMRHSFLFIMQTLLIPFFKCPLSDFLGRHLSFFSVIFTKVAMMQAWTLQTIPHSECDFFFGKAPLIMFFDLHVLWSVFLCLTFCVVLCGCVYVCLGFWCDSLSVCVSRFLRVFSS